MAEVTITIGGRTFEVACQDGEQEFLEAAAGLLDTEAQMLAEQIGRMPESRMLLMAGLMLADKTAGLEDEIAALRERVESQQSLIQELRSRPDAPERIEVPVIPEEIGAGIAELAARAETLAAAMEDAGTRLNLRR